ncbi:MAG TPA: hypothetical protein VN610_00200 [Bryobacteraceae bacterium]|nr:hypothetical protein [Bryobacteraceae bacterium]
MPESEEDDLDALPEGELLTLPDGAIPPGWLTEFFARRAALAHQQDSNELALELSGDSSLHLMIFRDMDPKEKRRRKEEDDRHRLLAEQELREYRDHSDRVLARIEQEQLVVEKRRKEIEDNALKLHDGRRVYADGNQYRDEQGRVLEGRDRDEADALHSQKPNASTWQDRQKTIEEADELARLKQKVLNDRQEVERGGDVSAANERLSDYEKEFQHNLETTRTEIAAKAPADLAASYSTDYMAAYGDEYTISTVPAFTKAADGQTPADRKDADTDNPQTENAPRPVGQIAPKI